MDAHHADRADAEQPTLPHVTVGVLDGRYRGAMAYALERALRHPSTILVARSRADAPVADSAPLDVVDLDGDPHDAFVAWSRQTDLLVVEVSSNIMERAADLRLSALRQSTQCLLVEVDTAGHVLRASGPSTELDDDLSIHVRPDDSRVVVAGVGTPDESAGVIGWAELESMRRGASLRLVCAYAPGSPRHLAEQALRAASASITKVPVQLHAVQGEPVDVLVDESSDAELLVVGGHRTTGLIHSAMGGVGDSCARLASCPVVIVPYRASVRCG